MDSVRASSTRGDAVGQTATVGIGFVDLVGSTEWAGQLSLKDHALALSRFESAAWDIATEHGGRVVKLIGDEAMIVAASAETVCRIAVALCAAVAGDRGLPGARAGVGFGDVIRARRGLRRPSRQSRGPVGQGGDRGSRGGDGRGPRDRLPATASWSRHRHRDAHARGASTRPVALFTDRPGLERCQKGGEGRPHLVGGPGRAGGQGPEAHEAVDEAGELEAAGRRRRPRPGRRRRRGPRRAGDRTRPWPPRPGAGRPGRPAGGWPAGSAGSWSPRYWDVNQRMASAVSR